MRPRGERQGEERKTTKTSIEIIEAINELGDPTLTDLADHTGLATSTLYSHLRTLERCEYLTREGDRYTLGLRLFHLGENARYRDNRYQLARQKAFELTNRTEGEVSFAVEEHGRSITLFCETGKSTVEGYQVGRYYYMHNSASGKAMLSVLPDARIDEILDRWGLPEETENTITDRETLFDRIRLVSERGYAINDEEAMEGLIAVGVPLRNPDGSLFGSFDVSGPPYRFPDIGEVAGELRSVARELESELESYETDD